MAELNYYDRIIDYVKEINEERWRLLVGARDV